MNNKFSLTSNTKTVCWVTLFQIKAEMSFGNITKWELGGWIEKESNLSTSWNAWVSWDAWVSWNAWVYWKIKLQFGWCFARKRKNWNITEIENWEEILLIKDYKPAEEEIDN